MNKELFIKTIIETVDPVSPLGKTIAKCPDGVSRLFFKNDHTKSLTKRGTTILKGLYQFWELTIPSPLTSGQLLILAKNSTLPYYVSNTSVVVFDRDIGVMMLMGRDGSIFDQLFER